MANNNAASENKSPATIDGKTLAILPTPPRIDLKTADDVRLEMARVYREMRSEKMESQHGSRLIYVLSQIGKMIETSEIEKRMQALELVLKQRRLNK